ncbi:MAG: beta-galactosidase [Erysipelotrichaceae bacterium]
MFLHGGDYNPEQWIDNIDLIKDDIEKLRKANINTVTLGMFSWSMIEPTEGFYDFRWLELILTILKENNFKVIMGTPTSARPHWLAQSYPETSRVNEHAKRELSGFRHNHCMQSPVFREKAELLISKLVEVVIPFDIIHSWHINNEFGGHCYCEHCVRKFRDNLREEYKDVKTLNNAWWNVFWSHNYSSFDEILPPFAHGERSNTPLNINWERFKTRNHIDYYKFEYNLIRKLSNLPITTNFHGDPFNFSLDYRMFSDYVDYISYDIYPPWNTKDNYEVAIKAKKELILQHSLDLDKEFYMMESTPGSTNWQEYTVLKSAKLHKATTYLQMLCSSKSFLYFQLKQSRGSSEKYHGAVLDVSSDENSRVYKYVKEFGNELKSLEIFENMQLKNEVAIYYDWNNTTMLHYSEGPRNIGLGISELNDNIFEYFNNVGINVEYVFDERHLDKFDTIIFPYAYNVNPRVVEKLKGLKDKIIIAFPMLNYVDENDLLHVGNLPYKLNDQFGVIVSEFNAVLDNQKIKSDKSMYEYLAEVVSPTTAEVLETFDHEILKSAFTKNDYNHSTYYYFGGIPTQDSLISVFDKVFKSKYELDKKTVVSNVTLNSEEYQMIINFGEEVINLKNVYWSNSMKQNLLEKYDFAIVKK